MLWQTEEISQTSLVDTKELIFVCTGRIACTIASMALQKISWRAERILNRRIRRWQATEVLAAYARLDVPTSSLRAAQGRLQGLSLGNHSFLWQVVSMTVSLFSTGLRLGAQTVALTNALSGHSEEQLLTWTTMGAESLVLFPYFFSFRSNTGELAQVPGLTFDSN